MTENFVRSLLFEGRIHVQAQPNLDWTADDDSILQTAVDIQRLHLAGPAISDSLDVVRSATKLVYRLAWRFLNSEPSDPAKDPTLRMPTDPRSPEDHWTADLALRFVAGIYRRGCKHDPDDPLVTVMKDLLRRWPLSGVLAEIRDAPLTPIDFGRHVGLGFMYAQRLAVNERSTWYPTGAGRDCVDLVWKALNKPPITWVDLCPMTSEGTIS